MVTVERMKKAGLIKVSEDLEKAEEAQLKLEIAHEHYPVVIDQKKIDEFNQRLREKTLVSENFTETYDQLVFESLDTTEVIPPEDVLDRIEKAQELKCFDRIEIGRVKSVVKVKDPIVLGTIEGYPKKFFIGQWDNDITLDDLI